MNIGSIQKTYGRYARIYDVSFGSLFQPGRKAVIVAMGCRPGQRILEVGVGTGLSLPLYPRDVRVTGIDVSAEMLAKARQRACSQRLVQVESLLEMDAENMSFPADSFDKVVAMYVVSVVPDPVRLVAEMRRVCKPNGDIFIVNHFHSPRPVIKTAERALAPLSRFVGFRPDFPLDGFLQDTALNVVDTRNVNLFGYWRLLHCRNDGFIPPVAVTRRDVALALR